MATSVSTSAITKALDTFNISRDQMYARRYHMTSEVLGKGSFGKVYTAYRAVDAEVWQQVAVKEIKVKDPTDTASLERIVADVGREGALMYNTKSPRVVAVYQPWFDEARSVLCIPQERCDESLETYRLRHRQYGSPLLALYSIVAQCLDALMDLQRAGTVHSDIKPDNVMLVWSRGLDVGLPEVKLADFGLGMPAHEVSSLREPDPVGTPFFMAPECYTLDGASAPHARDMWSMGCLFHQLLTGQYPFMGSTHQELRACVCAGTVVPYSGVANLDLTRRYLYLMTLSIFVTSPSSRPTPAQLQKTILREMSIPPPPVLPTPAPRTYRRMAVCRAQQKRIFLFTAASAQSEYFTPQFLMAGASDVFVLNEPLTDSGAARPARHSLDAGCLPSLPRGREASANSPMSTPCLSTSTCATRLTCARPLKSRAQWLYVASPQRGFCPAMLGGHATLHPVEDLPHLPCEAQPAQSGLVLDPSQLRQRESAAADAALAMSPGPSPHAPTPYNPKLRQSLYKALFTEVERG